MLCGSQNNDIKCVNKIKGVWYLDSESQNNA